MDKTSAKLTVFFESPFWVGVFERITDGVLSVCKVTFGAEPQDCEVWELILSRRYDRLLFHPAGEDGGRQAADHPKRRRRSAEKELRRSGVGTKSQQALQMQREQMKTKRRQRRKEEKEAEKERQFALKQQKRKERHRGH